MINCRCEYLGLLFISAFWRTADLSCALPKIRQSRLRLLFRFAWDKRWQILNRYCIFAPPFGWLQHHKSASKRTCHARACKWTQVQKSFFRVTKFLWRSDRENSFAHWSCRRREPHTSRHSLRSTASSLPPRPPLVWVTPETYKTKWYLCG